MSTTTSVASDVVRDPIKLERAALFLALAVVCLGYFLVWMAFKDGHLPASVTLNVHGVNRVFDLAAVTTDKIPNLLWGPLYALFWIVIHVWVRGRRRSPLADADPYMLPIIAFLCGIGLIMLYRLMPEIAFNPEYTDPKKYKPSLLGIHASQFWMVIAGFFLMMVSARLGPRFLDFCRYKQGWSVAISIALLVFLYFFGHDPSGSGRRLWVQIPGVGTFQPIEVIKVALVIFMAAWGSRFGLGMKPQMFPRPKFMIAFFTFMLIFVGACGVLKDFGPAVMIYLLFFIMFYIISGSWLLTLVGVAIMVLGGTLVYYLEWPTTMVKTRVDFWRFPFQNNQQIAEALWTLVSGGLGGKGLGYGAAYRIPSVQSDFNFVAICEETGFMGALGLVVAYFILLFRGYKVALSMRTNDDYYLLVAVGLVTMFAIQLVLILGGNSGALPLTGIVLPFISYGGTSQWINLSAVGLIFGLSSKRNQEIVRG